MHWFRNSFWKLCLLKSLLKSGIECWSIMGLCTTALQTSTMHRAIAIITLFDRNVSPLLFFFFSPPPHTHKYKSIFSAKLRRICLHNEACPFLSGRTRKQWQKPHKVNEWEWEIPPFFLIIKGCTKLLLFSHYFMNIPPLSVGMNLQDCSRSW